MTGHHALWRGHGWSRSRTGIKAHQQIFSTIIVGGAVTIAGGTTALTTLTITRRLRFAKFLHGFQAGRRQEPPFFVAHGFVLFPRRIKAGSTATGFAHRHLRGSQLINLVEFKDRHATDPQIKGPDVGTLRRRLRNQVTPKGAGVVGHLEGKDVLPGSVARPAVLAARRKVHVPAVQRHVALAAVQRPHKDHFVFAPATVGAHEAVVDRLLVGKAELERDALFRHADRFALVRDSVVNVVRNKRRRHLGIVLLVCLLGWGFEGGVLIGVIGCGSG